MRNCLKIILTSLCLVCSYQASWAIDQVTAESVINTSLVESRNQILKLTDKGPEPKVLHMKVEDSILFFLNDTREALTTLEVDFGDKTAHCASGSMQLMPNGQMLSRRPFGPRDFISLCFHEKGEYPVKIFGLKSSPQGAAATIFIE